MLLNGLIDLANFVISALGKLCSVIFIILPNNPFGNFDMGPISDVLGYLNYCIPISEISAILTLWLSAIGVYYIYQIVLRWIKVVD